MATKSKKRQTLERETAAPRHGYKAEFHMCQCCSKALATDLHEIARGADREESLKHAATWLALCGTCHEAMDDYAQWPITRQLALKLVSDPGRFDLPLINRIRGRALDAITLSDVVKHLRMKK